LWDVDAPVVRNVAIVVALALVVWLVPGGGDGANLLGQLFSAVFVAAIVFFLIRLYRQFQGDLFGLGDRMRLVLYGAVGALVLTLAGSSRLFETGAGAILWFVFMAAGVYGLFAVWRHWRAYD
jgi:surface polysaccharide O-acyltransferase-like enzyme